MSVRARFVAGFTVMVTLIWVTVFFATTGFTNIHREFEVLEGDIVPGAFAMAEMEKTANGAAHEVLEYALSGEEEHKQITLAALKSLEEDGLEHLEHETHIGQEEQNTAEELMLKIDTFTSAVAELIKLKEQGASSDEVLKRKDEIIHPALVTLLEQLEAHKATHLEELAESKEAVYETQSSSTQRLFLAAGLITLLAATAAFFTSRSIINPIHALHKGTEVIGQGNFDYKVGTNARDEIGQLSRAFDQMTDGLKKTTASIDVLNEEIAERKQREEELKRAADIIDSMLDGVTICDMQGRIININKAATMQLGYKEEELVGKNPGEVFISEGDRPKFYKHLEELASGRPIGGIEYQVRCKDGTEFPASLSLSVLTDPEGKPTAVVAVHRDITERKQREEALRQSEEKYRTSLNEIEDSYYEVDLGGNFTFVNDSACLKTGYSREQLIGMNYRATIVEEDIKAIFQTFNKIYQTGKTEEFSYGIVQKDGDITFEELVASGIRNQQGEIIGFRAVSRNITVRKQAEEALKQSEERLRAFMSSATDGFMLFDSELNYLDINKAALEILGLNREKAIGKNITDIIPNIKETGRYDQYMNVIRTGTPFFLDDLAPHPKFGDIHLSVSAFKVGDGLGITITNITERKRAEEEREALFKDLEIINRRLDQSNKELQDFAYIASHDLREPMRKIASFGMLLQDSLEGNLDEDQQENFKFMIDGASRMQMMIDDLLTYSRVTTKAKPFERVDLNKIIQDLKDVELATLLEETKGTINVPNPLPPVQGDPSQIHQLLQNLVGNGLKFHREGIPPEITIRAQRIKNMVHVEVQDNGIGIDEQYYEQVFTMFKRLLTKTEYAGTGIGLAVCKKIVDRHKGEISIESTPGEGSTFRFTLPRGTYAG